MPAVTVTWLGHSTFKVQFRDTIFLIDPWVEGNPACPQEEKKQAKVDLLLATHGHFDHIGDAVTIAKAHRAQVVGIFELCHWLESKGVENTEPMNKGGTLEVAGLRVTMVHADHSCGILDNGKILYGGEAVGYVIEFPNGFRLYHAGDTAVFGDMRLIGQLYAPAVACLPIGDRFTMSPREAALAASLLGVKRVIPMHHGTFPLLTGKPDQLRRAAKGIDVIALKPGQSAPL